MDAVILAEKNMKIVSKDKSRKYYRFRAAQFYGGIATADCVGCCLTCIFCWSWNIISRPESAGKFYAPGDVAGRLIKIAKKHRFRQMRISGNEPTLHREHLIGVLEKVPAHYRFILETNGILLGNSRDYCKELSGFKNLHVRVSLKGCSADEFAYLTGLESSGFYLQLMALENMMLEDVSCHPAVMTYFSDKKTMRTLSQRLEAIDQSFRFYEDEQLLFYPAVEQRLRKFNFIK